MSHIVAPYIVDRECLACLKELDRPMAFNSQHFWLCFKHYIRAGKPQPYCPACLRRTVEWATRNPNSWPEGPRHEASSRCESGKHPHCTCDTCF